jgi:hypothetical protein
MTHRKLGWIGQMMSLLITSLTLAINVLWWPRHQGLPILILGQIENHENFAFRIWNRARFFSQLQSHMPQPREPKLPKVYTRRFFLKIKYHRPQSSIYFGEILQFCRMCLGPPVF